MFDSAIPLTVAHQAPLSMEFSRQEYCSGLLFLSSEVLCVSGKLFLVTTMTNPGADLMASLLLQVQKIRLGSLGVSLGHWLVDGGAGFEPRHLGCALSCMAYSQDRPHLTSAESEPG